MLTAVSSSSPLKARRLSVSISDQLVHELDMAGVDLVVRQGVEHERVVGVRAMADADELFRLCNGHR